MATGYDNRQPGRNSFAFQPQPPAQTRSAASGNFNGAQIVGGRSTGGTGGADEFTAATPMASGLGQFFEELMAPHVERRKEEEFWKGFTEQSHRAAGEEIKSRGGALSKIFGPSGYEEGAVFYRANTNVANWANKKLAEIDDLKRLDPDTLSRTIFDDYQSLLTDDPLVNQTIQAGMFKAAQPVLDAVSKARIIWQQDEAKKGFTSNAMAQAELVQGYLSDENNIPDQAAVDAHMGNFMQAMQKPYGMTDETWHDSVVASTKRMAQMGYGYGVQAMMKAGLLDTLDPEDQQKLEDSVNRYAAKSTNKVLARPEIRDELAKIELEGKLVRVGRSVPGGIEGYMGRLQSLNDRIKRISGFDHDLFDAEEIVQGGMTVADGIVAFEQRRQDRLNQLEDMETRHRWEQEDDDKEEAEAATAAHAAWATGDVREVLLGGDVKEKDVELIANNDYAKGDYSGLARAFKSGVWVSNTVKSKVQANVTASIGQQYTDSSKLAYEQWKKMRQINPAMTQAYYGKYHAMMEAFDKQVGTLGPNIAFQQAFNNPAQYNTASWPRAKQKDAASQIKGVVDDQHTVWPWGRSNLNASSKEVLNEVLWRDSAVVAQYSDRPTADIVSDTAHAIMAHGRIERYGPLLWQNREGTAPIGSLIGLKGNTELADKVVVNVIDKRLKAAGYQDGTAGDSYSIMRLNDERGKPALFVQAGAGEDARRVVIPLSDFQSEATTAVSQGVARYKAPSKLNPYRRIKGESTAARFARIQREVKEGADPTYRRK